MERKEFLNLLYQKAISYGFPDVAGELVGLGANFDRSKNASTEALMEAAKTDDLVKIDKLKSTEHIDVDQVDQHRNTALMFAAQSGNYNTVLYLVNSNANPFFVSSTGDHALALASQHGHVEIVNLLLERFDFHSYPYLLTSALESAVYGEHSAIIDSLINYSVVPSVTALTNAVYKNNPDLVELLIETFNASGRPIRNFIDALTGYNGENTVLSIAAYDGFIEIVRILLKYGASVDRCGDYGESPLLGAVRSNHFEIVNLLLEAGADPNFVDANSIYPSTPLMFAAQNNFAPIVKILAKHGANLNWKCKYGYTALMRAAEKGYKDVVKELIAAGADLNVPNNQMSFTALNYAHRSDSETVKLLKDAGALLYDELPTEIRFGF